MSAGRKKAVPQKSLSVGKESRLQPVIGRAHPAKLVITHISV